MVRRLAEDDALTVYGTGRPVRAPQYFSGSDATYVGGIDVGNFDGIVRLVGEVRPHALVNCVGLVKQLAEGNRVLDAVPINTLLPHRLSGLCQAAGSRLIHISTDCVFSGRKGGYSESDLPDARDVYGLSKYLGEVTDHHAITLRTSIIGHEIGSARSLVEWFLSQDGPVNGYRNAIFSGLPTCELARVVRDYVLPRPDLNGLFHVSAEPISKFDLLTQVASVYRKDIEILPDDDFVIDRSLNSDKFRDETGYVPPNWPELIHSMRSFG